MVDIHCHILPGIDDGARSWESTIGMCEQAAADGVTHIVATPHANFRYSYDRGQYAGLLQELRSRFPRLQFSLGCDFHLSAENIERALANPSQFTINNSRYLLVEYSDYITRHTVEEPVRRLLGADLTPIITHPERNSLLLHRPEIVESLVKLGCLVQVTANSLTGFWGKDSQRVGLDLIKRKLVHFIASDAHSTRGRTTVLSDGVKAASSVISTTEANKLVRDNPAKLVGETGV